MTEQKINTDNAPQATTTTLLSSERRESEASRCIYKVVDTASAAVAFRYSDAAPQLPPSGNPIVRPLLRGCNECCECGAI